MLSLLVTLLTIALVVDCLILTLLILMQLPKKEAGLGQAFGSSATDALFGAGSGNVLTKTTKYAAGAFFGLAILLTILGPRANMEKIRQQQFQEASSTRSAKPQQSLPVQSLTPASNILSGAAAAATKAVEADTNK